MKIMKEYIAPDVALVEFHSNTVIAASYGGEIGGSEEEGGDFGPGSKSQNSINGFDDGYEF